MNAEQVVNKILSEAHQQASAIAEQAAQKNDAQTRQLEQELSAYRAETERQAKDAAEDKRSRMLAAARMDNARALLAAKGELLNEVFKRAEQRIVQMPDDAYRALMVKLMVQAVQTGDEEVIVGKDERRINDDLIKQVNRQLGAGFRGNLRLSDKRADIKGGFILSRGKVRMNGSVEVLIDRLREAMETELAAELFAE
jgi:V/A-type H+-transporting ATPase subunit E